MRRMLFLSKWVCLFLIALLISSPLVSAPYKNQKGASVPNDSYKGKGGETKEVTVDGYAQITTSGEQDAFNAAVQQALRSAVEKVLGSMVKSETMVKDAQLISDKIYSKSSGFVQKYEVISDEKKDGTKLVKIKAWVVLGDVKDDAMSLGLLQDRVGRPVVIVLIDEKSLVDGHQLGAAKSVIQQKMMDKQFVFVDEGQLNKVLAARNIQVAKLGGVSANDLAAVAVDAGAQIIIKGSVSSAQNKLQDEFAQYFSTTSTLNLDAIYAADASIVASSSATKPTKGYLSSLETAQVSSLQMAGTTISTDLIDKIIKRWDDFVNNGFEYTVTIGNCDFDAGDEVKTGLEKNIEGVKKVVDKGFNENAKVQEFLVRYTGQPRDLAKAMKAEGKIKVALGIKSVTSKTIIMEVKK